MIGKLLRTFIIVLLLYEIKCNLQPSVNNVYDPLMKLRRRRSAGAGSAATAKEYLKDTFMGAFGGFQSKFLDKHFDCMPGSYYFNRSCYYFSRDSQKFTWLHAESFCRHMPLNTTMLTIKNNEEFEFIRQILIHIRQKENYRDQLVFNIGFNYTKGEWRWINNSTFRSNSSGFNMVKTWSDWDASLGYCGTIVAKDYNEVIMRSAPCHRTDERFICTYVLNACLNNNKCGTKGKCINLYQTIRCECTSVFYEGKYCEKYNSRAIQTFIALGIVGFFILYLIITGKKSRECFGSLVKKAEKTIKKRIKNRKEKIEIEKLEKGENIGKAEGAADEEKKEDEDKHSILIPNDRKKSIAKPPAEPKPENLETLTSKLKKHLISNLKFYDGFFLIFIVCILTALQIVLIHIFKKSFTQSLIGNIVRRNETVIYKICDTLQRKYLSEELIYAPFAMLILGTILVTHRSARFTNYLMIKYKTFFGKKIYKKAVDVQEDKRVKLLDKKLESMTTFQRCRYRTKNSCFCKFLCCICCCTCCGGGGDEAKKDEKSSTGEGCSAPCCCCCEPILKTDCCRVLCMIKKILRCLLCIDLWCCIRGCIMEKRERDKEKKEKEEKEEKEENEKKQETGDLDESLELTKFQFKWPIPLLPYSTTNRLLSTAVYIAYTYDILNIFMYLNSSFLSIPLTPFLTEKNGVLKDFLIQILQVVVIGFKFYPILAVADIEPHIATYSLSFIYVFIMWTLKMFNKGFCSRTEAFVKFSLEQVENQIHNSKIFRWNDRLNLTNRINMNELDETEESKYKKVVNEKIPQIFDKFFGPKSEYQGITTPSYMPTMFTQTMNITASRSGFRKKIANKTLGYITDVLDGWSDEKETDWATTVRNLLENLPLYISLSFLLARFLLTLIQLLIKSCEHYLGKCAKDLSETDQKSFELIKKAVLNLSSNPISPNFHHHICDIYEKQYGISKYRTKNHNYDYVAMYITSKIPLHCDNPGEDEDKDNQYISFTLNLLYKIYEPVRHFRFSKQLINTYMVAFMLIYFFTVFIVRTSSVFGAWFVRSLQVIFQLLFGSILPSFSFQEHNLIFEFAAACVITSLISYIQLLASIKSFQKYVLHLHRGGELSNTTIDPNVNSRDLFLNLFKEKRNPCDKESKKVNISEMMASHSLHYPGYLIAHLVYAYFLMFIAIFIVIIVVKLVWYIPQAFELILQIFLPVMILLLLRLLTIKFLTRNVFLKHDSHFISNLTPYFVISYFNFFFDCFLGFVACMNRVWQTTIVSLFYLPRLDKTMFNEKETLLLQQLDKGHLAYMNFVHMEHLYNNPVLISFTEILVEMMFISYIRESKLRRYVRNKAKKSPGESSFQKETKKTMMGKYTASVLLKQPVAAEKKEIMRSVSFQLENNNEQENFILSQVSNENPEENNESGVVNYDSEKRWKFERNLSLIIEQQPRKSDHMCIDNSESKPRPKFERQATIVSINGRETIQETLIEEPSNEEETNYILQNKTEESEADKQEKRFKYTSYRKLCNLFYLYVLLKRNRELCKYTAFNMKEEAKKCKKTNTKKVESWKDQFSRIFQKSSGSDSDSSNAKNTYERRKRRLSKSASKSQKNTQDSDEEDEFIHGIRNESIDSLEK